MTLGNQIKVWAALLLGLGLVLWMLRGILLPFVLGIGLAYLLNPTVDWLVRRGLWRGVASLLVILFALLVMMAAILLVVPVIVQQGLGLARNLPDYMGQFQGFVEAQVPRLEELIGPQRMNELESGLQQMFADWIGMVTTVTGQVMQSGIGIINTTAIMIVTPVVASYMLIDWHRMVESVDNLLPKRHKAEFRAIFHDIDVSLGGFLRGQGAVILILAAYYGLTLSLTGLHFGLAIGIMAGLLSFIPYVGSFLGFVFSIGLGSIQFWPEWIPITTIVVIYVFGQLLESYFLYPKLVGSSIQLHPVWMMFAIFAFGVLFGVVGVVIAVPLAAISGVLVRWAVKTYKQSPLYDPDPVLVVSSTEPRRDEDETPPRP